MAVVVLLGACSSSSERKSHDELGIDDGASAGTSATAVVTPEQGGARELSTGAEINVPAGAVDVPIELGLKRPPDAEAIELVSTLESTDKLASAPYVLTPHGTKFMEQVEVKLPVAEGADKKKLAVAWLENEEDTRWKLLGTPKISGDTAVIAVEHFSVLVLVEPDADGLPEAGTGADAGPDGGVQPDGSVPFDASTGVLDAGADAGLVSPEAGTRDAATASDPDTLLTIGVEGGTIEDERYGSATVPAGAVTTNTEFRIVADPDFGGGAAPPMPLPYQGMSAACFRPYNRTFAEPIDMYIMARFAAGPGAEVAVLQLDDQDDTSWSLVSSAQVNAPGLGVHEAIFQTTTLGCFGFATYTPL